MTPLRQLACKVTLATYFLSGTAVGSQYTIGPNGIDSNGLTLDDGMPLTGGGIGIGQVEIFRPGKRIPDGGWDNSANTNTNINPEDVFVRTVGGASIANMNVDNHAEYVAGVMISTDTTDPDGGGPMSAPTGVATGALLYSSAFNPATDHDAEAAISAQHIALQNGGDVRAINMSFSTARTDLNDGNQLLTQFIDWSAAAHDVLYVVAGKNTDTPPAASIPTDNYNGMTIGRSTKVGNVYRQVSANNDFSQDADGDRTTISLIAPGDGIDLAGLAGSTTTESGSSLAAPHVTGTVALLQQYAEDRIPAARWGEYARRHEVMKAVLMNSADKLIDNGTIVLPGASDPVPKGGLLGMTRTVIDRAGQDWRQSEAYGDDPFSDASRTPLDDEMGAGHLNARRALQQFASGEYESDAGAVPVIGWDYGHTTGTNDLNKYTISEPLLGGSVISITMAWDRIVSFDNDGGTIGQYDINDTFEPWVDQFPPADDVINDLDLYLLPAGSTSLDDAIAASLSADSTIEHLFFQIPSTGQYEFWVHQWDNEATGDGQDYGIAWWAKSSINPAAGGDYSGNGTVGPEDYTIWKSNFGTSFADADGNGDGIVDAADYTIWRDNLGAGSGSLAAVPEPSAMWLLIVGLAYPFALSSDNIRSVRRRAS